jgi:hypothetical protein
MRLLLVLATAVTSALLLSCGSGGEDGPECQEATGADQAFCGSVTVDGLPAADGTRIRAFVFCNSTDVPPIAEATTSDGGFNTIVPATIWTQLSPCQGKSVYFRVGSRWANETGSSVEGTTQVLNLTVTDPPLIPRPEGPEQGADPRLMYVPRCWDGITDEDYLAGMIIQPAEGSTGTILPIDEPGVEEVNVSLPDQGISDVTDVDGCFQLIGLDVPEATLVTLRADKAGYQPSTRKNLPLYPGGTSADAELRTDRPVVTDGCAFDGPPVTGAQQGVVELCSAHGLGPEYLLRACPNGASELQQAPESLTQLVGITLDASTGSGLGGANVRIPDYQLSTVSQADGCFRFDVFDVPAEAGPVSIEVEAPGYPGLTLRNYVFLSNAAGLDLKLDPAGQPQDVDACLFSTAPANQVESARERACDQAGVLTRAY